MRTTSAFILAIFLGLICVSGARAVNMPAIGFWKNRAQGWVVETYLCDTGICGRLISFRSPESQPTDSHNPDPAKRSQSLCGLRLLGGFQADGWEPTKLRHGWVYDPQTGKTYSGEAQLTGLDTIELRGYVGIPLFGRTLVLTREPNAGDRCDHAAQPGY